MTIASPASSASFAGNGVTLSFPLPFRFVSNADVAVVLRHADGTETQLTETTDYTLSGAGEASGGACALASPPLPGQTLVFTRAPRILQETDYQENDAFPAESHEEALDLLTMICQALDERLGRAPLLPVSCGLRQPVLTAPAPGRALIWNEAGTALEAGPEAGDITSAQGFAEAAAEARAASMVTPQASEVPFDPAASGLSGTTAQAAIDELAGRAVGLAALDGLHTLLLAEALRRAIGDSVDGREFLGNGWIDPLADADEVTITNGAFVSADGGYLTNAGGGGAVTAADLTAAQFLDEKGSITAFTVDTADTSGHFDAPVSARIKAGCLLMLDVGNHVITSITGDGTAANSVAFLGTRAVNTFAVTSIHGAQVNGSALELAGSSETPSSSHALSSGDRTASIAVTATIAANTAHTKLIDGVIDSTYWWTGGQAVAGKYVRFDLGAPYLVSEVTLSMDNANDGSLWKWQGSTDGSAWVDLCAASSLASTTKVFTLIASAPYRYFQMIGTSGTCIANAKREVTFKAGSAYRPAAVIYPAALSVDCTDWTALKALARTETLNSQSVWFSLFFDGVASYSAFAAGAWLPIVRDNAGTWEC